MRLDRDYGVVPIGRPTTQHRRHILEDELCTVRVARGYLNRSELTAERFVADPSGEAGRAFIGPAIWRACA